MARVFGQDERCQRLAQVEGVGPLIATALVAAVGNAHEFKSGRELSAWLGLVPRQHSSGGRTVLLGISKRGDRYLRTSSSMGHARQCAPWKAEGIRVASRLAGSRAVRDQTWRRSRSPTETRVLWALLTKGEIYRPAPFSSRIPQVG